jgi:hypothetical protein
MKLEHQHQQHEAGTSIINNMKQHINNMKLEHQHHHHQQHQAWNINIINNITKAGTTTSTTTGTSTSICGNRMRQVHQQQHLWYSDRPSLPDLRDLPRNHKIP